MIVWTEIITRLLLAAFFGAVIGEFIVSLRFNKFNKADLARFISTMQANKKIKEVTWND